jgi:hypothetical protein
MDERPKKTEGEGVPNKRVVRGLEHRRQLIFLCGLCEGFLIIIVRPHLRNPARPGQRGLVPHAPAERLEALATTEMIEKWA